MKIISAIDPSQEIKNSLKATFPFVDFRYFESIEDAGDEFYDAEVFITYGEDLTEEYILKTTKLKWIMVMSAGMEKMPFSACSQKGILITNARGIHKIPMAEYTIGSMLAHVKKTKLLWENQEKQIWDRLIPVEELNGKTILILGVGAIGGEIARLASAFRMKVLGVNQSGKPVEFVDELYKMSELSTALPQADFLVSILPSTFETKFLLNEDHFKMMKRTSVFINIGRGDVVEESILMNALERQYINHAYLDCFIDEPLRVDHPFWKMPNVTITPHLSSKTKGYLPRSFEIFSENLHTYINNGEDYINKIEPERGY